MATGQLVPRDACRVGDSRPRSGAILHRVRRVRRVSLVIAVVVITAGCSASVNDDLAGTPTPDPLRAPVVGPSSPVGSPALATPISWVWTALDRGDLPGAAAAAATVVVLAPDNPDALAARAEVRFRSGDFEGARSDLDRAVNRAPRRADLLTRRARIEVALGEMDAALADDGAAIAREPGLVDAFIHRAWVRTLIAQGAPSIYQAALDDANRALALDPGSWPARIALAKVYLARAAFRGDPADLDHAQVELEKVRGGSGGPTAALIGAQLLAIRGDVQGAHRQRDDALEGVPLPGPHAPAIADIAFTDATIAFAEHDWNRAAASAREALMADPERWDARVLLAESLLGAKDHPAALDVADLIRDRWPEQGVGWYLRGAALTRLGDPAAARAALEQARALLAASPVYQARIGQAERQLPGGTAGTPEPVSSPQMVAPAEAMSSRGWRHVR